MTHAFPHSTQAMTFIVTRDREKSKAFFRDVLGFTMSYEDPFAAVFDLNGTSLRISTVQDFCPQAHTVLGWQVPDIVASVQELASRGVRFTVYEGMGQDKLAIWTAPGGKARVAWFVDPDGNNLSLSQF